MSIRAKVSIHSPAASARESAGVQSLETGLKLLIALMELEPLPMLKTIAAKASMHPAKAHRYLASFCKSGFVEQDAETGRYRLAQMSLRLGLSAMNDLDAIRITQPLLPAIRDELGHSVILCTWSVGGPTVVLLEPARAAIAVTTRVGLVLPLLSSSTGRAFAAWLPDAQTAGLLKVELARHAGKPVAGVPSTRTQAEALFREIRKRGMARVMGQLNPGVSALSAPVFDHSGEIAGVLSTLGPTSTIDADWDSPLANALRAKTGQLSKALGFRPETTLSP